ncbi:hypothetical protein M8C21_011187, partial [Ambrosia artemisiifolia]
IPLKFSFRSNFSKIHPRFIIILDPQFCPKLGFLGEEWWQRHEGTSGLFGGYTIHRLNTVVVGNDDDHLENIMKKLIQDITDRIGNSSRGGKKIMSSDGFKVIILKVEAKRIYLAVNVILSFQVCH